MNNPSKGIRGKRDDGEPAEEREHFYICKACGQAVDRRELGQVLHHHEQPGHKPMGRD